MDQTLKILIIEDVALDAELAQRELIKVFKSVEFRIVQSEKDYIDALLTFHPDLIVSDYILPGFDGLTALEIKLHKARFTPFVILTGSMNEDTAVEVMKAGADDYVLKERLKRLGLSALNAIEKKRLEREQFRTVQALKKSEERYRTLMENIDDLIYRFEFVPQKRYTYISPSASWLTGYTPQEFYTDAGLRDKLIYPSDKSLMDAYFESENNNTDTLLLRWLKKDGMVIWTEERNTMHFDDSGKLIAIDGVVRDITDRKLVEEHLEKSEELLTLIAEHSADVIWILDLNTYKFIYISPSVEKLRGYSVDEVMKNTIYHALTPKSIAFLDEALKKRIEKFLADPRQTISYVDEIEQPCRDGSIIQTEVTSTLILQEDGRLELIGVSRNITERKKAERAIKENEIRFRTLFEQSSDGVGIFNVDGKFIQVNPKLCELFDYSMDEFLSMHFLQTAPPDSESLKKCTMEYKTLMQKGYVQFEADFITKSGKIFSGELNAIMVTITGKKYGQVLFRDVSERKMLESRVRQSQKMKAIGTLAGGIAHDFNNMLSIIMGNVSYALTTLDKNSEIYEILSDAQNGTKQAQSLTQQLLTFSKGGAPIKKISDLNYIIRETASFVTRGERSKCIFKPADNLWTVEIDPGQINQSLSNLIINANHAMPNGGTIYIKTENLNIDADSQISLEPGKYVKISIEDQGIGISRENLINIFDPYFTTKQRGSGLGLATTYSIIKRHGGNVTVYSELGKGTVFHIYLPASSQKLQETEKEMHMEHQGNGKILVMDDQEQIVIMVTRMLNKMGYTVLSAEDGEKAIELFRNAYDAEEPFDLVILDLTIPGGLGGAETIPELLKIDPQIKAVVSSGYSNDPIMANYKHYGFSGVVPKPFTKDQLSELLNQIF